MGFGKGIRYQRDTSCVGTGQQQQERLPAMMCMKVHTKYPEEEEETVPDEELLRNAMWCPKILLLCISK